MCRHSCDAIEIKGNGEKEKMAHPKGFEPLAPRFVVWCSIQLSYGCALEPRY